MIQTDIRVDYLTMEDENGICTQCGHAFGPHVLMATMISPEHGGLIFCAEKGCTCQSPWSLDGQPMPYIPDEETIANLRTVAQSDEESDDDWDTDSDIDIWVD